MNIVKSTAICSNLKPFTCLFDSLEYLIFHFQKCYWAYSQKLTRNENGIMGLDNRLIDSAGVNINRNELYISGGYSVNGLLKSMEVHTHDTDTKAGIDMPFPTSDHCMVQFRLVSL